MKKRNIFNCGFGLCLLCLGGYLSLKQPSEMISDLTLENIEALTNHIIEEGGDGVIIECGSRATKGRCWIESGRLKYYGQYQYYECDFEGHTFYYCTEPV